MIELSAAEATAAYNSIKARLKAGYAASGVAFAKTYQGSPRFNSAPYRSTTHGNRFVNNYTNTAAYGKFEDGGVLPHGTLIAKDSFIVSPDGSVAPGPLFLMEKMTKGFDADTGDWRYTLITADGQAVGVTGGKGAETVQFCANCHASAEDHDYLFYLPKAYRE